MLVVSRMRLVVPVAAFTVALAGSPGWASQKPVAAPSPVAIPSPAAKSAAPAEARPAPEYRIGAGDVLEVNVFGSDDLSRTPTVQTSGAIVFPLLGEVPVAGMTVMEVKDKLATLLGRDYIVRPQVEVKVKEYHSQFVTVLGEVNTPGRKLVRGPMRLIDALVEAGGFSQRASGEVVVTRLGGFPDGTRSLTVHLSPGGITAEEQARLEMPLVSGDIVQASPKLFVTVEGEVARPGRYAMDDGQTVSAAVMQAGGLTRVGSGKVKLRRIDPATGGVSITTVDLGDVRKGKKQDPVLAPGDVISVGRRIL